MKNGFKLIEIKKAEELPDVWDDLGNEYFQTKEFLIHTEKYNPCGQSYLLLQKGEQITAGVILYSLSLNLLTFLRLPSPIKMRIAGIPCSVSASGFVGSQEGQIILAQEIRSREPGLLLALNLDTPGEKQAGACGITLPTMVLKNRFTGWEDYKKALRSSYRRRLKKLETDFQEVQVKQTSCGEFTDEMHALYLAVLKKSRDKLETLSADFFSNLPSCFRLSACYASKKLIGWYITVLWKDKFYFFLGGLHYKYNKKYNTYFNNLKRIIKEGIESKATLIDLGQTAENPKAILGGAAEKKHMTGHHSWAPFNWLLKKSQNLLSYKKSIPVYKVFREEI